MAVTFRTGDLLTLTEGIGGQVRAGGPRFVVKRMSTMPPKWRPMPPHRNFRREDRLSLSLSVRSFFNGGAQGISALDQIADHPRVVIMGIYQ